MTLHFEEIKKNFLIQADKNLKAKTSLSRATQNNR
jgi:hypothetical protein